VKAKKKELKCDWPLLMSQNALDSYKFHRVTIFLKKIVTK
jgi:hypothetical protein